MDKKLILIVDDDEVFLKLAERDLNQAGYLVITARNGKEGAAAAREQTPDLVLMDINMPGVDGGEARFALKSDPATKDIPVIFITALVTKNEEKTLGSNPRGDYFIAKPYDAKRLIEEVHQRLLTR